jgi:molybdopterin synthase catalytic subunit
MEVRVLLFGHYRDALLAGAAALTLDLPAGATVADAARHLGEGNPGLADLLARTRTAVNAEFAPAETVLRDGDEVAFLPPMSGG